MPVTTGTYVPKSFGANDMLLSGSFITNGATVGALSATTNAFSFSRGLKGTTVSSDGAGIYTVTLPVGISFPAQPWSIMVTPQAKDETNWFDTFIYATTNLTSPTLRSFMIACHRAGTLNAPALLAENRINFWIIAGNTTGG